MDKQRNNSKAYVAQIGGDYIYLTPGCYFVTVPGQWVAWSPWSSCSVTCGLGGQRTRTRTCNMTTYGSLTLPCLPLGGENDAIKCNNFSCFPVGQYWNITTVRFVSSLKKDT